MKFQEFWEVIHRWWWMIVVITVVATATSAIYSYKIIKPTYEATASLLVNQRYASSAMALAALSGDISANESLIQTYSDILESNAVMGPVIAKLSLPYTDSQLGGMVSVTSNDQSEIFSVNVDDQSVVQATAIANTVAREFQHQLLRLVNVNNVQIIDPAVVPSAPIPIAPKKEVSVAIAFILGLMVSVGLAFFIEYLDDTVRIEEEAAAILDVTVLGVIPFINSDMPKPRNVGLVEASNASHI